MCTTAFRMGIDVPNVEVIVRITCRCPLSLEELIQEFESAGRDGRKAMCDVFAYGSSHIA